MLSLLLYNKIMDFSKYLTKEGVIIVAVVIYTLVQSNYFATKLDIANLRLELQQYSDTNDKELNTLITEQYKTIIEKIDRIKR